MQIRPATPADARIIANFNAAMALETEHKTLDPAILLQGVHQAIQTPDSARYLLAEVAGQVIGQLMITFEWSDWRNANFWWIQSVYVHPDFRRQKVFTALYAHAQSLAKEAGACGLRLYVERDNAAAQAVYRQLGMNDAGYTVFEVDWSKPV